MIKWDKIYYVIKINIIFIIIAYQLFSTQICQISLIVQTKRGWKDYSLVYYTSIRSGGCSLFIISSITSGGVIMLALIKDFNCFYETNGDWM